MNHKFALSGLAEGSQQSESCLCPVSKSEQVDLATHNAENSNPSWFKNPFYVNPRTYT